MVIKNKKEAQFTSTDVKLLGGGLERLVELQRTGLLRPQSLQLAPADACQLDCTWCSTKYRNFEYTQDKNDPSKVTLQKEKKKANYIPFEDIEKVVGDLMEIGPLKTVELTGAGDSTMYRDPKTGQDINDVIDFLYDTGLQIGMITNGMGLTRLVTQDRLDKLTWLRISLASFDPQNFKGNNDGEKNSQYQDKFPDLPDSVNGELGFSYVWGPHSRVELLDKIVNYAKDHQVDFVRIVPDCLDVEKQGQFKEIVSEIIKDANEDLGKEVLFFQSKRYDVHESCRIGFLKPFLNADGYFYHCSAVPLYNQAFTPHWRMGHLSEVKKIWTPENVGAFDTGKCEYGKCFYAPQNEILDAVANSNQSPHKEFL